MTVQSKTSSEVTSQQFHKHPKILLIDIKDDSEKVLKCAGFNIKSGTFGTPYKVSRSNEYLPIAFGASLPNYQEQEIVVIDLIANATLEKSPSVENVLKGEKEFWGHCNQGVIDPRPRSALYAVSDFNKILSHNGVFVVFADQHSYYKTVFGQFVYELEIIADGFNIWDFIDTLNSEQFETDSKSGTEMSVKNPDTILGKFLNKYIDAAHYTCTIKPAESRDYRTNTVIRYSNRSADSWVVTAVNKYNEPVAGVFAPDAEHNGWIFIFPQINDKANFLLEFLRDILPEFASELFPFSDNRNWIERNEYQSAAVQSLNKQTEEIEVEAKQKIEKINEEIQQEKEKIEYQYKLLTDDSDSLVKAVEQTFKVLGFTNVINVDEEYEKHGKTNNNDEDLQIRDKPTSLLVEVKGVTGFPSDNDSRQVTKHVPIRMREWQEFDVKALSIINHQKALPALDREKKPFRPLILESAEQQYLGLMTTFDLYRLVRSFLKNRWKHENIKDLFIQSGHISIVPVHYEYVGLIENYWEQIEVVGIRVEENSIRRGDTIAFESPIEFEEMNVNSLQVEKLSVEVAEVSMLAGIKTTLSKQILKKGSRVFRIITPKP